MGVDIFTVNLMWSLVFERPVCQILAPHIDFEEPPWPLSPDFGLWRRLKVSDWDLTY